MLSNRHTKIKLSRQICTVLQHTTFQKQFYKIVVHLLLAHDLTSEPYAVWCRCCSQAKQMLKWLGSLHQTHGNRISSESVLLSLISDKKDPNFKKMHIFQRRITTQSHGTWYSSISLLYSALKLVSPGARAAHIQQQSAILSKCTLTKCIELYYTRQTNSIYSSFYGPSLCSNQLYKRCMKIIYK